MKVFLVGISDADSNSITSIHKTYEGSLKSWNRERLEIIKLYKRMKYTEISRGWSHEYDNNYNESIKKLSCEDPKMIDNYPHETPYIQEFELEE